MEILTLYNNRDRLVELVKQKSCDSKCEKNCSNCWFNDDYRHLADYLIENGVLVSPCKVGETLYLIQIDFNCNYRLSECLVNSKITMLSIMRAYEEHTIIYMSTNRTAAEEKLKELEAELGKDLE